jgi:hypothetical protein
MTALKTPIDDFYSARIVTSHFILATGLRQMKLNWSTIVRIGAKPTCGQEQ